MRKTLIIAALLCPIFTTTAAGCELSLDIARGRESLHIEVKPRQTPADEAATQEKKTMFDYVPARDVDLTGWATNYSALITAAPTSYGLVSGDATALAALVTAWNTAIAAATNPATRTEVTVAAKVTARANLVFKIRALANIVQATPTVTDAQKTNLGLTVRDSLSTPVPPPVTSPVISVSSTQSLQHTCRFADTATPLSRAKPVGVGAAEIYVKIGPGAPASIADCVYRGTATKVPFTITYDSGDAGKTAYIMARWINRKGEPGPQSAVASGTIAA
jgi:hypothetical protein